MKSRIWFVAAAGGLIGTAVAFSAPRPVGGHMPARPAAMPHGGVMPHPMGSPFVGRPMTAFPNGHLGALTPQSQVFRPQSQVIRPSLNPVVGGGSGIRPLTAGPRPLLTNPHPNVVTAARTSAFAPNHFVHSSGIAALSAASGKSPAEVALFLASQNGNRWGWGGWGWGGSGWGWGWGWGWGFPWGFGPGWSIGFGYRSGPWAFGLGYTFGYSPAIAYAPVFAVPAGPVGVGEALPAPIPQADQVLPAPVDAAKPAGTDFAQQGQELFLAGKYDDAVKALRHAVVDDPRNGPLLALTGEALWAGGHYNEAAGALQQSLLATPEADWPGVAGRAARLIPADAVGNLAKAIGENESPDLRFLAAYQSFGAGKYDEAAGHLDLLLKKAPDDAVAKKLREQAGKLAAGK